MEITVGVIVFVLYAISLIGIFIPFIPGLVLAWAGFMTYLITQHVIGEHLILVSVMTLLTVFAVFTDTIFSLICAKIYNSSKYGVMGGILGFFAGLFFFPPFGAIVGPFLGVYVGEVMSGKEPKDALKAITGSVIGFLVSIGLKVIMWVVLLLALLYVIVIM